MTCPHFRTVSPDFAVALVLDSGGLALSAGPVRDPDGRQIGTFNSVWRREAGGRWKVVFDKGCPPCDCKPAADKASKP